MRLFNTILLLVAAITAMSFAGCSNASQTAKEIERALREAEAAVAKGDMDAARSVASTLTGDPNLQRLSSTQAARLSMVYMQMAETLDTDNNFNTETATNLYDKAFSINADSAQAFYNAVHPAQMQYVATLSARSAQRKNPVDISKLPDESAGEAETGETQQQQP